MYLNLLILQFFALKSSPAPALIVPSAEFRSRSNNRCFELLLSRPGPRPRAVLPTLLRIGLFHFLIIKIVCIIKTIAY